MNPMPELSPLLKRLRLSGILDSLETRNREAIDKRLSYVDFLAHLIADEVARREQKKFHLRLRRAGFRSTKTLEQFDATASSTLNPALLQELASCRFIEEHASVLIESAHDNRWRCVHRNRWRSAVLAAPAARDDVESESFLHMTSKNSASAEDCKSLTLRELAVIRIRDGESLPP